MSPELGNRIRHESWLNIKTPEARYAQVLHEAPFGGQAPMQQRGSTMTRVDTAQQRGSVMTHVDTGMSKTYTGGMNQQGSWMMPTPESHWQLGQQQPRAAFGMPSVAEPPVAAPTLSPTLAPTSPPSVAAAPRPAVAAPPASAAAPSMQGMQMLGQPYPCMPGQGVPVMMQMPGGYMQMVMMDPRQMAGVPQMQSTPQMMSQMQAAQMSSAAQMQAQQGSQRLRLNSLLGSNSVMAFPAGREPVTTVMLRNIPQKFDREVLMADLDSRGFQLAYDFLYLPVDFNTNNSMGYAFINFVSEAAVASFRQAYSGLRLSDESAKICEVADAKTQGKDKNIEYYRNSSVMGNDEKYHPVSLQNGVRQPFPKPTRALKVVQQRPARAF